MVTCLAVKLDPLRRPLRSAIWLDKWLASPGVLELLALRVQLGATLKLLVTCAWYSITISGGIALLILEGLALGIIALAPTHLARAPRDSGRLRPTECQRTFVCSCLAALGVRSLTVLASHRIAIHLIACIARQQRRRLHRGHSIVL